MAVERGRYTVENELAEAGAAARAAESDAAAPEPDPEPEPAPEPAKPAVKGSAFPAAKRG